jgi:hypothetical protein
VDAGPLDGDALSAAGALALTDGLELCDALPLALTVGVGEASADAVATTSFT